MYFAKKRSARLTSVLSSLEFCDVQTGLSVKLLQVFDLEREGGKSQSRLCSSSGVTASGYDWLSRASVRITSRLNFYLNRFLWHREDGIQKQFLHIDKDHDLDFIKLTPLSISFYFIRHNHENDLYRASAWSSSP